MIHDHGRLKKFQVLYIHNGVNLHLRWKIQTKIFGTTFLQNSEESIMDGLEFLAFTLQYFLADVKPYLVSNLELMMNHVFFMPMNLSTTTYK